MNDPVRDEIEFHIQERTRELRAQGVPAHEARRRAEAAFGDVGEIRREVGRLQRTRDRRRSAAGFRESVRGGVRGLVRRPRHSALVVGTLALGIGATVAIFSVVDAVLLEPLPFAEPDRLVRVWESDAQRPNRNPAPADFLDLRLRLDAFSQVAAYVPRGASVTGDGVPERIRYADVSANFFQTLGVVPVVGGGFGPAEVPGSERVAVISHGLWIRRYGGDPGVVGRSLEMNRTDYQIVGVAPEGFTFPDRVSVWVAAPYDVPAADFFGPDAPTIRDAWYHTVVARLAPGISIGLAGDQVAALGADLRERHPDTFGTDAAFRLVPLRTDQIGDLGTPLTLLLGATALVLLIVAVNVANLALVQAAGRAREWGVRLALGAARTRIVALVLAESVALAVVGGALGTGLAWLGVEALRPSVEPLLPVTTALGIDAPVLAFALVLSLGVAVAFGVVPALVASRRDPGSAIDRGAGSRTGSRLERRVLDGLVAAEVALAVVLVLGAGLLLRSLENVRSLSLGLDPEGLTMLSVGFPEAGALDPDAQTAYWGELERRIEALPAVEAMAWGQFMPTEVGAGAGLRIRDRPSESDVSVRWHSVSADYFEAVGIALLEGRAFESTDRAETERVAVINETLARRFFPDGDAVGRWVNTGLDGRTEDDWNWVRVVGVADDLRNLGPEQPVEPMLYRPMAQQAPGFVGGPRAVLHIRSTSRLGPLVEAVRGVVREVNPDAPVDDVRHEHEVVADYLAGRELVLTLVSGFATLALLLGALGIYGATRHAVQRRTREIGVRMAIGAARGQVIGLMVRRGLTPAGVGLGVGLTVAALSTRVIESRLFGITALDPLTWGSVALLLGGVAVVAAWMPARRAAGIDPVEAIRSE